MDPSLAPWMIFIGGVVAVIGTIVVGRLSSRAQTKQSEITSSTDREGFAWDALKVTLAAKDAEIARKDTRITFLEAELERRGGLPSGPISRAMIPRRGGLSGVTCLLVDDDPHVADYLKIQLEQEGARVTLVASAEKALERYRHHTYSCLIVDFALPGKDGCSFLRAAKSHDEMVGAETPPAICISGLGRAEDRRRAAAAGFAAFVEKNGDGVDLAGAVRRVLGRDEESGE